MGDVVVCDVVLPDSHRRGKREKVKIPAPNPLFADNRHASFLVPPVLTDFKYIRVSLAAFLHLHEKEVHTQHLVFPTRGKNGEVLFLLHFADITCYHFQPCPTFGASVVFCLFVHNPAMTAVHAGGASFGQTVGVMVNALTESPIHLCFGYGAEFLALCKYRFLEFVSRFHRFRIMRVQLVVHLSFGSP